MKTQKVIIVILSIFFINVGYAQPPFRKVLRTDVIAAKNNKYRVKTFENWYSVENIDNLFIDKNPNYNISPGESLIPAFLLLKKSDDVGEAIDKLEDMTDLYFGAYIEQSSNLEPYSDCIAYYFRSDLKGNLKDIHFSFPAKIIIPIEAIEMFEKEVKSIFKVSFTIDHRNENALYINAPGLVYLDPIREKRAVKK